jgi:hypothetical protein
MKHKILILLSVAGIAFLLTGCESMVTVPPYPTADAWNSDVKPLGTVTATSGVWPLSLHSTPSDYTFQSALREKAASQFGVPQSEVVLGQATVQIGAEIDGTIRDWTATAQAGRRLTPEPTKSPSDALIELKKLLDAGAITQQDYDAKKKALLDKIGQ